MFGKKKEPKLEVTDLNKIEVLRQQLELKKDYSKFQDTLRNKAEKRKRDTISFLWDLKTKFADKQHEKHIEKIKLAKGIIEDGKKN